MADLAKLRAPFPPSLIKDRQGGKGQKYQYIPTWAVVERLNDAADGEWSWHGAISAIEGGTVIVHGELTIGAISHTGIGAAVIAARGDGGAISDALENAVKSADSDALKRAARLFGVGLELYRKGQSSAPRYQGFDQGAAEADGRLRKQPDPAPADTCKQSASDCWARLAGSEKQIAAVRAIAMMKRWDQAQVELELGATLEGATKSQISEFIGRNQRRG